MAPLLILVAFFGLAIGSFVNVVIYRVPRDLSVLRPGSRCTRCDTPVKARHNIPLLGWLLLRGRCAHCGERISARYPLVELATAVLFVAVTARFGASLALPAYLYLTAVGVALTMIDFDVRRLPNAIVLPSYLVGALLLVPPLVVYGDWAAALRGLAAMAALWCFYFVFYYAGGMGFGDVKLAGLLGLYLGWLGWSSVLVGTFTGFLVGGLAGAVLLATRRAGRRSPIPFGPAMLAGALVAMFLAGPIATWYTSLLTQSA